MEPQANETTYQRTIELSLNDSRGGLMYGIKLEAIVTTSGHSPGPPRRLLLEALVQALLDEEEHDQAEREI